MRDRDEDYGLTPREWLDSDPVPLTPDIDFNDPEQRIAWIRANNAENEARWAELQARRERRRGARGGGDDDERGEGGGRAAPVSITTVVGVRLLNAEQRALVRLARRQDVTVSDLVRRWVRAGLAEGDATDPVPVDPDEQQDLRQALFEAADAVVDRITDELRRLREMVSASG